jgi:hypothetical protein
MRLVEVEQVVLVVAGTYSTGTGQPWRGEKRARPKSASCNWLRRW